MMLIAKMLMISRYLWLCIWSSRMRRSMGLNRKRSERRRKHWPSSSHRLRVSTWIYRRRWRKLSISTTRSTWGPSSNPWRLKYQLIRKVSNKSLTKSLKLTRTRTNSSFRSIISGSSCWRTSTNTTKSL